MNTDTADLLRILGITVPHWKLHAMDYLDSVGQQFCIDYGYENCVEKAREHWRRRRARKGSQ